MAGGSEIAGERLRQAAFGPKTPLAEKRNYPPGRTDAVCGTKNRDGQGPKKKTPKKRTHDDA